MATPLPRDHAQLEAELHYKQPVHDTRLIKTRPPGSNILIASGGILFLLGFTFSGQIFARFFSTHLFGRLAAAGLATLVGGFLGFSIPPRIWRALGPTARALLRPLGYLGGAPFFFFLLFCLAGVAAGIRTTEGLLRGEISFADLKKLTQTHPMEGPDWQPLWMEHSKTAPPGAKRDFAMKTYAEAQTACEDELGPGWRLPTQADLGFLDTRIQHRGLRRIPFMLEDSKVPGMVGARVLKGTGEYGIYAYHQKGQTHPVVCIQTDLDLEPEDLSPTPDR